MKNLVKPTVFKMCGSWVWLCYHHTGGPVGDDFPEDAWRSAWDACLAAAVKHTALYHVDHEPIEVIDL